MDFHLDKNLILESNCEFDDAEYGIVGFPFDSTSSYRPGSRFGPLELRKALLELDKPEEFFQKKLYDLGNLNAVHGNLKETLNRFEQTLSEAFEENPDFTPITLGGEHSASYVPVKLLHERHPDLQIAHFDAHPDLMDDYLGEGWSHATVMKRAYDLGVEDIVQFGVRVGDKEEKKIMEKLPKKLSDKPTYISLDMDALDPTLCPGVGTPEPGGFTPQELFLLLGKIPNVVGLDIVEMNPLFDRSGVTSVIGAKAMLELILK